MCLQNSVMVGGNKLSHSKFFVDCGLSKKGYTHKNVIPYDEKICKIETYLTVFYDFISFFYFNLI